MSSADNRHVSVRYAWCVVRDHGVRGEADNILVVVRGREEMRHYFYAFMRLEAWEKRTKNAQPNNIY